MKIEFIALVLSRHCCYHFSKYLLLLLGCLIVQDSREFIKLEELGAYLLLGATILALILSNSPWHNYYEKIFQESFSIRFLSWEFRTNMLFLINEGLMSVFFLVVGLEIKYEVLQGTLNSSSKAMLPAFAAFGGMIIPALIYVVFNYHNVLNLRGWAIPTATDIAFALGVLSLLGSRASLELKSFLTALAIFDDLAAIVIIAIFYTEHLSFLFLGLALVCFGILFFLNIKKINKVSPYFFVGISLWFFLFKSGVNPTLAGVALALFIPINCLKKDRLPPLMALKKVLHPGVALGVLPIFAFANAGISFVDLSISRMQFSIAAGILVSLFLGKQVGVFLASWLAVKYGFAQLPNQVRWIELYGVSVICGIGFTISLFIGTLAFGNFSADYVNSVKIGALSGSLLSGIFGYLLLIFSGKK